MAIEYRPRAAIFGNSGRFALTWDLDASLRRILGIATHIGRTGMSRKAGSPVSDLGRALTRDTPSASPRRDSAPRTRY
jgi:hypothetical protein